MTFSLENRKLRDLNYEIWERIIHEERFPTPAPSAQHPIGKERPSAKTKIDYAKLKDRLIIKCGLNGICQFKICGVCTAKECDCQKTVLS